MASLLLLLRTSWCLLFISSFGIDIVFSTSGTSTAFRKSEEMEIGKPGPKFACKSHSVLPPFFNSFFVWFSFDLGPRLYLYLFSSGDKRTKGTKRARGEQSMVHCGLGFYLLFAGFIAFVARLGFIFYAHCCFMRRAQCEQRCHNVHCPAGNNQTMKHYDQGHFYVNGEKSDVLI